MSHCSVFLVQAAGKQQPQGSLERSLDPALESRPSSKANFGFLLLDSQKLCQSSSG